MELAISAESPALMSPLGKRGAKPQRLPPDERAASYPGGFPRSTSPEFSVELQPINGSAIPYVSTWIGFQESTKMRMVAFLLGTVALVAQPVWSGEPIEFKVQWLTIDANEGCDIGDLDGDGNLDVIAGRNWYRNGDWIARPVRTIEDERGYLHTNGDFLYDVNGDGRLDLIAGDYFTTQVYWYENVGGETLLQGYLWPKHLLVDTGFGSNEASYLHDLNGDGTPEWITNSWVATNPLIVWEMATEDRAVERKQGNKTVTETLTVPTLKRHFINEGGQGHGFGFGDINNDGRVDILTGTGWHEGPAGDLLTGQWTFHADWNKHLSDPVLVRDLNGDGRNDVIVGNPHDYGLFVWYAEGMGEDGKLQFREETVDKEFSQLHCIHLADIDGDGQDELITGKRVRAHNGNDPGGKEPPLMCYYDIDPKTGKFHKHMIEEGHVGIGLQIRTADIDADGDLDIVVAGKEGTQILYSQLKD
ncbi:MAG: VCBS repeat-containing protein [Planctomycetaceae bacterium]|nr:VCBS repeat-containing protein [Planctomycetaceae bacterium]